MGLLSRNASSAAWFTLQDEPVDQAIGEIGPSSSRPARGRGLVKLVEPAAPPLRCSVGEAPASALGVSEAGFTRVSALERLNARASRVLSAIAATRLGALALSLVIVSLALATIGLLGTRSGSDHAQIQAYKAQVARLVTDRDRALHAAAQERRAYSAAQAGLARRRLRAPANHRIRGVANRGAGHSNSRGGGR